jgi:hypothetical protein
LLAAHFLQAATAEVVMVVGRGRLGIEVRSSS